MTVFTKPLQYLISHLCLCCSSTMLVSWISRQVLGCFENHSHCKTLKKGGLLNKHYSAFKRNHTPKPCGTWGEFVKAPRIMMLCLLIRRRPVTKNLIKQTWLTHVEVSQQSMLTHFFNRHPPLFQTNDWSLSVWLWHIQPVIFQDHALSVWTLWMGLSNENEWPIFVWTWIISLLWS